MTHKSGAQIVAVAAWLSVLGAAWYGLLAGQGWSAAVVGVMGLSALVGIAAGAMHKGDVMAQRKSAAAITDELKRAAVERMNRGRP